MIALLQVAVCARYPRYKLVDTYSHDYVIHQFQFFQFLHQKCICILNIFTSFRQVPIPYKFAYHVKDTPSHNDYSHEESSDGSVVTGSYSVLLPDGRKQTVTYTAGTSGYVANVQYSGQATHPEYSYKTIKSHPITSNPRPTYSKHAYSQPSYPATAFGERYSQMIAPVSTSEPSPVHEVKVEEVPQVEKGDVPEGRDVEIPEMALFVLTDELKPNPFSEVQKEDVAELGRDAEIPETKLFAITDELKPNQVSEVKKEDVPEGRDVEIPEIAFLVLTDELKLNQVSEVKKDDIAEAEIEDVSELKTIDSTRIETEQVTEDGPKIAENQEIISNQVAEVKIDAISEVNHASDAKELPEMTITDNSEPRIPELTTKEDNLIESVTEVETEVIMINDFVVSPDEIEITTILP